MTRRLIVIALFEGVDLLDVTGPPEVFSLLQRETDDSAGYDVVLAATATDPVPTSAGVRVVPDTTFYELCGRAIDTLLVPGSVEVDDLRTVTAVVDSVIVEWVRDLAGRSRRVASVCAGAHILAAAGLLDGKRATTHWSTAHQLAAEHPTIAVDSNPIYIRDGDVWTGAGISSCIDLSLALVADDFGEVLAQKVARQLVVYLKRSGGQNQFSAALKHIAPTKRVEDMRLYVAEHAANALTVSSMAQHFHLSDRQLTRIFKADLGTTPAAYIESVRVEIAKQRLASTDETLVRIADASGFGTADTMARAFRRSVGITPGAYRQRFSLRP
ncbi:DJ-1/PfpI family protein [Gordonia sp. (in: high G+C Gram-positive bacteria)]|uniref:GlxA family transcriptional regulator n=1 Tax=Gordonia sp. (in: high G+C Gram-positive bacteria) TaxID=84139 RepID=UPI00333FA86A